MNKSTSFDLSDGMKKPKFALAKFTLEEFYNFWPGIEAMLDSVPHTWQRWTKEYILNCVEHDVLQVWGIGPPPKAVLIFFTQLLDYPADKILTVPWGAGNFTPEMLPILEAALVNYAQLNQCAAIEIRGRPGWEPHFKAVGLKRDYVTWTMPVPRARIN